MVTMEQGPRPEGSVAAAESPGVKGGAAFGAEPCGCSGLSAAPSLPCLGYFGQAPQLQARGRSVCSTSDPLGG